MNFWSKLGVKTEIAFRVLQKLLHSPANGEGGEGG